MVAFPTFALRLSMISQLHRSPCIHAQLPIQIFLLSLFILKLSLGNQAVSIERSPKEKLRIQLLHLMSQHNARESNAVSLSSLENLLHSIEGDALLKKLVTLDLSLRQLACLQEGDHCDPSRQPFLDNPPPTPTPPEIISWQLSLLSSPAPLCNYLNHLHCSGDTGKCLCRDGLVPHKNGLCVIPVGGNCGSHFYFRHLYFDPLLNSKVLVEQPPPSCTPGLLCTHRPLFFRKKCWCPAQRANQSKSCDERAIFRQKSEYFRLQHEIQGLFTLKQGELCDPEFQQQILNPPEYELIDTRARILYFQQVLTYPFRLCNLKLHLNCSDVSRRCECWSTMDQEKLTYEPEEDACVADRGFICGNTSLGTSFYIDGPTVFELEKVLTKDKDLGVRCIKGTHCQDDPNGYERCVCKRIFFGPKCLYPGSNLTRDLQRPKIFAPDICSTEINNIFDQVNAKMFLLEGRLRLGFNSPCDVMQDYKIDIILNFWVNLSSYWGLGEDSLKIENLITLQVFLDIRDMAVEILDENPEIELCNRKDGFSCSNNGRCRCRKGTTLQNATCRILARHPCDVIQGHWSLPCVNYANCLPKDGVTANGTCWCIVQRTYVETIEKERAICEKPEDDGIITSNSQEVNWFRWIKAQDPSLTPQRTNQNLSGINDPAIVGLNSTIWLQSEPQLPNEDHMVEIRTLLLELSTHRVANLEKPCIVDDNEKLLSILQSFTSEEFQLRNLSADKVESLFHQLRKLVRKGNHFCDAQKHLICSSLSSICQCKASLTVSTNGDCRIPQGQQCRTTELQQKVRNLGRQFILPLPKCMEGLSCAVAGESEFRTCVVGSFHHQDLERRLGAQAPAVSEFKHDLHSFIYITIIQLFAIFIVA